MSDHSTSELEAVAETEMQGSEVGSQRVELTSDPDLRHPRWRTARRLMWLLRPFRGTVAVLLLLSLAAVAIDVVPPMLQGVLVDHVLRVDPARRAVRASCCCCWRASSPGCWRSAWPPCW